MASYFFLKKSKNLSGMHRYPIKIEKDLSTLFENLYIIHNNSHIYDLSKNSNSQLYRISSQILTKYITP